MGSKKDSSYGQTLAVICDELFSLIAYLREIGDIEQPDVLYNRAIELFSSMEDKARQLKIPDADVRDAKYAIVAVIDENMGWASRLEQEFFSRNVAGEEFFNRLDELKKSKGRNDILEVYYICLTLGFEGRHFRNPERIKEYIAEIQEMLDIKRPGKFSPRGEGSQAAIKPRRSGVSSWVPWLVAIAGSVILVGVIILLRFRVASWASGVISRIQELLI